MPAAAAKEPSWALVRHAGQSSLHPKREHNLRRMLKSRHKEADCLTILPMEPFSPRACSRAVRRETVTVNPPAVMLHASVYKGKIN